MNDNTVKERDISIDILKCIAAIAITNSHMELLYGKYDVLATGGAIGDVLFFFCSGYTLFLGRNTDFLNWYKRRINRIYPTVFAWALLASAMNIRHYDMFYIIKYGGGWFVCCIMIFYVILWFVKRFAINKLTWVFAGTFLAILAWYWIIGIDDTNSNNMYGDCYFKWCHYFLYMLLGAFMGLRSKQSESLKTMPKILPTIVLLTMCVVAFYGLCWFKNKEGVYDYLQMMSIFPLMGVCYFMYRFCNTKQMAKVYNTKIGNMIIRLVGGLCLEIYLIQSALFTDKMNAIFPLNLVIMFVVIVVAAYLLRCVSRIWSQTFKEESYSWKEIVKLY